MLFRAKLRTILVGSLLCGAAGTGAVVLSAPPASATPPAKFYASASGSGDCTSTATACSLSTALSDVVPGGTIELVTPGASGHYVGRFTLATSATTSSTPVTIEAAPGVVAPTLDANNSGTVLTIKSGVYVNVTGITITGGNIDGGIVNFGTLNVTGSTIIGNTSGEYGGGIFNDGTLNVTGSDIVNNTAGAGVNLAAGGGVYNIGTLNVTDSTIVGNTVTATVNVVALATGGGIYNTGTLKITDSTITGNTATTTGGAGGSAQGNGIYNNSTSTVNLGATIIAGNSGGNCSGTVVDLGYNLTDDSSCALNSGTDLTVTSGSLNLGPLANNGGPTETLLPLAGSPAIGVIPLNTTINSVQVCPRIDQRGLASASNVPCNIGAVEGHLQTISFTSTAPSATVGGSYTPTATSTSGLAVIITVDASSGGVCSINGSGVVSFLTPGTCTLDANQAGDTNYAAAAQMQQSVTVSAVPVASSRLIAQAPLTLTSTSGVVGTPLTLGVTGGTGTGALSFILVSSGSASCTLSGDTLMATSVGTCSLLVFKAGDATHLNAASSATTVTFTPSPLTPGSLRLTSTRGVVGTPLTLTSKGGAGTGTVSYALKSAGPATCTLHGDTLMAKRAGTCRLILSEAATSTYAAISNVATVRFTAELRALRVEGRVRVAATSIVTIIGTGFYDKPTITSNDAHTSAVVIHDHGTSLVVRVRVRHGAATGWHEFTITLANGHSCRVRYFTK